jgi:hypothetical protein
MAQNYILNLIEGNNVNRLDMLFKLLNLFNQKIHRHLLIFNHTHDLQLVDSKAHRHKLCCKRNKKYTLTATCSPLDQFAHQTPSCRAEFKE